jgi:hypothetical protein
MRSLFKFAAALLLAGCAGSAGQGEPRTAAEASSRLYQQAQQRCDALSTGRQVQLCRCTATKMRDAGFYRDFPRAKASDLRALAELDAKADGAAASCRAEMRGAAPQ